MPGYRGHLIGGVVAFTLLSLLHRAPFSLIGQTELLFITCLGALFPDIDTKSRGQRYFYSLLAILFIILFLHHQFIIISLLAVAAIVPLVVAHRGPFHNPKIICFIVILCILVILCTFSIRLRSVSWHGLYFFIGSLSHLFLDYGIKRFFKKLF